MIHAREDYNRIQDPENKIPKDEPVFLLRGQDVLAPKVLMVWATQLITRGGDKELAQAAVNHAVKMVDWREKHIGKLPDKRPTFKVNHIASMIGRVEEPPKEWPKSEPLSHTRGITEEQRGDLEGFKRLSQVVEELEKENRDRQALEGFVSSFKEGFWEKGDLKKEDPYPLMSATLHRHTYLEEELNVPKGHVIIDKEAWEKVIVFLKSNNL